MLYPGLLTRNPIGHGLLRDLVAYWPLSEQSGSRLDLSGNGSTLTDNNTVTGNPGPSGKLPDASQFTRLNNESLSIADNATLSSGDIGITYACWFYMDSKPADYPNLMGKRNTNQNEIVIFYANGAAEDRIKVGFFGDGLDASETDLTASSFGSPSTGAWHFVLAWHDAVANTINVQVNDGTVDSAAYTAGLTDTTGTMRFGGSHLGAAHAWDGRIAAGSIWKRILTASERRWLRNGGAGRSFQPSHGFY